MYIYIGEVYIFFRYKGSVEIEEPLFFSIHRATQWADGDVN